MTKRAYNPEHERVGPTWQTIAAVAGLIISALLSVVVNGKADDLKRVQDTTAIHTTQIQLMQQRADLDRAAAVEFRKETLDKLEAISLKQDAVLRCIGSARCNYTPR